MSKYRRFLESEIEQPEEEKAYFHVFSSPHEASVSYGRGTEAGPEKIIEASSQLELWDGKSIPADMGIFTHLPFSKGEKTENQLKSIEKALCPVIRRKQIPVVLGGEHSISLGAVKAFTAENMDFGVIQFDAHADLRDSYEGSKYSHACVMHRVFDLNIPFYQIGIRSLSPEEVLFREEHKIPFLDANQLILGSSPSLPDDFPENVYLTFDIDALDPSIMPATGTPEPGGLLWYQSLQMIEAIALSKRIIGFDCVELAPIKGLHFPEFTAARLVYQIMGIIQRNKK